MTDIRWSHLVVFYKVAENRGQASIVGYCLRRDPVPDPSVGPRGSRLSHISWRRDCRDRSPSLRMFISAGSPAAQSVMLMCACGYRNMQVCMYE